MEHIKMPVEIPSSWSSLQKYFNLFCIYLGETNILIDIVNLKGGYQLKKGKITYVSDTKHIS